MKKRVLWLLNHTSLRNFEVPMLIEMGFEVFVPKICEIEYGDLSTSVTYEYDSTLTIPECDLNVLNKVDFYEGVVSQEAIDIMNRHFDIAIFASYIQLTKLMVRIFKGQLILRPFGLAGAASYTSLFASYENVYLLDEIRNLGNRFWFGSAYKNLAEVECDYFNRQFAYLPLGLKNDTVTRNWTGGDKRILFIGPKILTNSYYRNIYKNFKKNFGDIPHVIGGGQMIPVTDDPTVIGFVPKEQYEYNMTHLAAMYYHSQEPRHLHYHPLEAVANGMPLVFMAGGMLDELGGKNLPGRCETTAQAHRMLERLSKGDRALAKKLINSQGVLLDEFKKEYCKEKWKAFFERELPRCDEYRKEQREERVRIAVVIPAGYTGGVLDFSIRMALAIQKGASECGDNVDVVLYHVDDPVYEAKDYFKRLKNSHIAVRSFKWAYKNYQWCEAFWKLKEYPSDVMPKEAYVMEDGMSDLKDCQYVIFTSDAIPTPYFSGARCSVVVHDVIQRYVPIMFDEHYEVKRQLANRRAEMLFATTPSTKDAAVQYIGVPEKKIKMLPQMFEIVEKPENWTTKQKNRYFHWGTNVTPHKNHKVALNALREYYARGGVLKCCVTGVNTDMLDPKKKINEAASPYIHELREQISKSTMLKKNLVFYGELERDEYLGLLSEAQFTFHPGYGDNGNGVCVEAAQMGVPALSSDYPPMRYMDQRMALHFTFCNPYDPASMAEGLQYMEKHAESIAKEMPDRKHFDQFTWQGQYKEIYEVIRSVVRGY